MTNNRVSSVKFLTAILCILLFLAGCGAKEAEPAQSMSPDAVGSPASDGGAKTIVDMMSRSVEIPANVDRIAVNFPAANEAILMLGQADKIVATNSTVQKNPWFVKIYPGIMGLPIPFENGVNIEELVATKPDVVIMGSATDDVLKSLDEVGIPAIVLSYTSPEELKQGMTILGQILGAEAAAKAEEFNSYYDANMKRVTDKTSTLEDSAKLKVYYAANGPLNTEGKKSIVTSWIGMAGGVNSAAEGGVEGMFQDVSMENLLLWNPDVIIARDAAHKTAILQEDRWKEIEAVKNNRVYVNPKGVFVWCVRSADEALQVLWAAKTFHPDLFTDIDMNKEVRDFYIKYYNYNPTDAEIMDILEPKE